MDELERVLIWLAENDVRPFDAELITVVHASVEDAGDE